MKAIGGQAVQYAQQKIVEQKAIATTNLLQNINFKVVGDEVYIGTNVEYAPYIEFGTGKYSTTGGGTPKESWVYRDELTGEFHMAYPMRARPYLKPAASEHTEEYRNLLKDSLENA